MYGEMDETLLSGKISEVHITFQVLNLSLSKQFAIAMLQFGRCFKVPCLHRCCAYNTSALFAILVLSNHFCIGVPPYTHSTHVHNVKS